MQRKIAGLRTDLDSFTEVEAYALMLSGYLMSEHELRVLKAEGQEILGRGPGAKYDVSAPRRDWPFLKLESLCKLGPDSPHPGRQISGSNSAGWGSRFLKVWDIAPAIAPVREAERGGIGALAVLLAWALWDSPVFDTSITWGGVIVLLGAALLAAAVPISQMA